jgi:rfaE bifunctional protein nucleotidyltransferase chain/domain
MLEIIKSKIQSREAAHHTAQQWKQAGRKVVFTNGCFDLLHYGHIHYLAQARSLGDALIVGLNSADSVRRLKGPGRPINDETTRCHLLASLQFVDMVVTFEEDTPLLLIQTLLPDILVKGGDYTIENIVGAQEVLAAGGTVKTLSFVDGYSTTAIENRIRNRSSL